MSTPMHPTSILTLDELDKKSRPNIILLYLIVSRLDIMFSVYLCACFESNPRESHLIVFKRIFIYLKGTTNLCPCFKKSNQYKLKLYNDADFARDKIETKSTSEGCHFIGANLDYDIIESNIPLLCDNTIAINLSKNPILHSCAKHIEIKHHFIRDYDFRVTFIYFHKGILVHIRNLLDTLTIQKMYSDVLSIHGVTRHPQNIPSVHSEIHHPRDVFDIPNINIVTFHEKDIFYVHREALHPKDVLNIHGGTQHPKMQSRVHRRTQRPKMSCTYDACTNLDLISLLRLGHSTRYALKENLDSTNQVLRCK
ncbi:hypothetical protein CR513_20632, partial [Mucuna pruriens]